MPTIEEERCSQCNGPGPLLACDDGEAVGKGSANMPRFCNKCMIGKSVKVFWPVDESWYTGVVQEYDAKSGEHRLQYPDGDTEWVKIGEIIAANAANSAAPSAAAETMDTIAPIPPIQVESVGTSNKGNSPDAPPTASAPGRPEPQTERSKWMGEVGGPYYGSAPYPQPPPQGFPPGSMAYGGPPHMTPYGMYAGYLPGLLPPYGAALSQHLSDKGDSPEGKRKTGPKPWSKEEDALLLRLAHTMQWPMKWTVVAQSLPGRTGKQCRERYVNHLNPRLKNSDWTPVEDATIFHLYNTIGSHWAKMSKIIPGRTDNGIKNRFHNIRRQYEREDKHRLRLSSIEDFPEELRLDRLRKFPEHLAGKSRDLWEMTNAIGVLAAQSVLGGSLNRTNSRFGPFRPAKAGDICVRCGLLIPSVHTGKDICTKTGWCQSCARLPPNISGNLLRECLNLRRADNKELRKVVESWEDYFIPSEENAWPYKTDKEDEKEKSESKTSET